MRKSDRYRIAKRRLYEAIMDFEDNTAWSRHSVLADEAEALTTEALNGMAELIERETQELEILIMDIKKRGAEVKHAER